MTQINLLPWREHKRQIKKAQFTAALVSCVAASIFVVVFWHVYLSNQLSDQLKLNDVLQVEINKEQASLNDMSSKENEKATIENQLQFIINLYKKSYIGVQLFNQLVKLVPNSISLSKIERNGNSVTLAGTANTDDELTQFMQEMTKSSYFNEPVLTLMNEQKSKEGNKKYFEMDVSLKE
jgi:type IV pilus assembly protein PilN